VRHDETRFDAFRLSSAGGEIAGSFDPGTLPRLAEDVVQEGGEVAWRIRGIRDSSGRPALSIEITGRIPLECQRCLGTVELEVDQRTEILLAHDEAELERLDGESDLEVALAEERLDAHALVEDELLLTLPYAPRHEDACPTGKVPDGD